ncbi:MAG: hypothetical protein IIT32_01335, partial [Bacteroidales bacterium]|nr:hypothetical protein [Bacteroidales bacterium]
TEKEDIGMEFFNKKSMSYNPGNDKINLKFKKGSEYSESPCNKKISKNYLHIPKNLRTFAHEIFSKLTNK